MDISRRSFLAGSLAGAAGRSLRARPQQEAARLKPRAPSEARNRDALPYWSLTEAAALLRARKLSPVELTEAVLDRIDRLDSKVGAFITVTREDAMRAARAAEREIAAGRYRGPLHGI